MLAEHRDAAASSFAWQGGSPHQDAIGTLKTLRASSVPPLASRCGHGNDIGR